MFSSIRSSSRNHRDYLKITTLTKTGSPFTRPSPFSERFVKNLHEQDAVVAVHRTTSADLMFQ